MAVRLTIIPDRLDTAQINRPCLSGAENPMNENDRGSDGCAAACLVSLDTDAGNKVLFPFASCILEDAPSDHFATGCGVEQWMKSAP